MLRHALRSTRALRTLAWGAVAVGIATPLVRHRLRLRPPVVSALSWPAPAALALAAPRTPLRDAGIYALADVGLLRPLRHARRRPGGVPASESGSTTRSRSTACSDSAPRPRSGCNARSSREGHVGPLEYGLSAVHWSWFLIPHGTCAYILLRHRRYFERSAVLMAGVLRRSAASSTGSLPTAPPWWAPRRASCRRSAGSWPRPASASGDVSGSRYTIPSKGTHLPRCPHSTSVRPRWQRACSARSDRGTARWAGHTR